MPEGLTPLGAFNIALEQCDAEIGVAAACNDRSKHPHAHSGGGGRCARRRPIFGSYPHQRDAGTRAYRVRTGKRARDSACGTTTQVDDSDESWEASRALSEMREKERT